MVQSWHTQILLVLHLVVHRGGTCEFTDRAAVPDERTHVPLGRSDWRRGQQGPCTEHLGDLCDNPSFLKATGKTSGRERAW